jgi:adenosine deaminase CECR1
MQGERNRDFIHISCRRDALSTGSSRDSSNSNRYSAVVLGRKRVGHGFACILPTGTARNDQSIGSLIVTVSINRSRETGKDNGTCVELCTVSNELLRLCGNIKEHPFTEVLAAGIPCTWNRDNASLFGYVEY